MKKNKLVGSILAVTILVLVSFTSLANNDLKVDENINFQPNDELTKEHLKYLLNGFRLTRLHDFDISIILFKIIFKIIKEGIATIDDIQGIVDSSISRVQKAFILTEIKTTELSEYLCELVNVGVQYSFEHIYLNAFYFRSEIINPMLA